MKNIHLLPTIKPSRVYNILGSKIIGFTSNDPFYTENFGGGTQNLNVHITSNEKVKDGDWFINTFNDNQPKLQKRYGDWITCYNQHKIILTTDPELIKDGVQAIDDEFFRWFVNNPSCEFIKVEPCEFLADKVIYEIIIPQETPEDAAERIYDDNLFDYEKYRDGFKEGSKWQQAKRMYSEEEVIKFLQMYRCDLSAGVTPNIGDTTPTWFEQHKKK